MDLKRTGFSFLVLAIVALCWFSYIGGGFAPVEPMAAYVLPFTDLEDEFSWAKEAVAYLAEKGMITGIDENTFAPNEHVTREQLAQLLTKSFSLPVNKSNTSQSFSDVPTSRWSFYVVDAAKGAMAETEDRFQPTKLVTREEACGAIMRAMGVTPEQITNDSLLDQRFTDAVLVDPLLKKLVIVAVEKKIVDGMDGRLTPQLAVRRGEIAVMLYRALQDKPQQQPMPIEGQTQITVEQAKTWARGREADQRFIDAADLYWKYGAEFGLRPEVLYCQAAKETNFGKYTGRVTADMNNWAGIKTAEATGDETADHQTFNNPDDGVRGHFNHMSAYTGTKTVGELHPRYHKAASAEWAGKVEYVEELGGKWAPDENYGRSIITDYLDQMLGNK